MKQPIGIRFIVFWKENNLLEFIYFRVKLSLMPAHSSSPVAVRALRFLSPTKQTS
jgi:hypothetical protein